MFWGLKNRGFVVESPVDLRLNYIKNHRRLTAQISENNTFPEREKQSLIVVVFEGIISYIFKVLLDSFESFFKKICGVWMGESFKGGFWFRNIVKLIFGGGGQEFGLGEESEEETGMILGGVEEGVREGGGIVVSGRPGRCLCLKWSSGGQLFSNSSTNSPFGLFFSK